MQGEKEFLNRITSVVPSERQIEWQKLEFTAFFHYGLNSFMDQEWGSGKEDIRNFNPGHLDTDNWCGVLRSAGVKGCILTCKHHDGFCLWDTKYTEYCVRNTPYHGDVLLELSKSCRKYHIKLGVYLSPWDRHEPSYGSGCAYDDFFCGQLTELLTQYGSIYTVWLDGACGEGPHGRRQVYDWERYYRTIRRLSPDTVISVSGPDVRWCGNESGSGRQSEWSVVPEELFSNKAIAEASQHEEGVEFRSRVLSEQDQELGSREILALSRRYIWYPAEVDVSIRPGWFYHACEDEKVRSREDLFDIYLRSAGGNCMLLLNIPPHPEGYIAKQDKDRLEELGALLFQTFQYDLTKNCIISSGFYGDGKASLLQEESIRNLLMNDGSFWKTGDFEPGIPQIVLQFQEETQISYIILKENIRFSQRIEAFRIELKAEGSFVEVYPGTTVGYQKICKIQPQYTAEIRIIFTRFRKSVILERISVF